MQCNIDAKGRAVRFRNGLVEFVLAVGLLAIAAVTRTHRPWLWVLGGLLAAGGAFMIFEARVGWCVLRAMGIRTRL